MLVHQRVPPKWPFFYIMEKQFPKKICDKRWLPYLQSKPKYGNILLLTPLFLLRRKPLVSCKWSLKLIHGVNFNAPSGSIAEMVVILPCCLLLLLVVVVVVLVVVVVVVVVVVIVGTAVTASTVKTYFFLKVCYSAHGTPKKREQLFLPHLAYRTWLVFFLGGAPQKIPKTLSIRW